MSLSPKPLSDQINLTTAMLMVIACLLTVIVFQLRGIKDDLPDSPCGSSSYNACRVRVIEMP